MNQKLCAVSLMLLACAFLNAQVTAQKEILVVSEEWPPYASQFMDKQGVLIDLLRHVFHDTQFTIRVEFHPWARALSMVEHGQADCIIGVFFAEERTRFLEYPLPLLEQETALFQLQKTEYTYSSLEDLKKYTVGKVRHAVNSAEFDGLQGRNIVPLVNLTQCIQMLLSERIDMFAGPVQNVNHLLGTYFPADRYKIKQLYPVLAKQNMYCGISRKSPQKDVLLQVLNERIRVLRENGTYARILREHNRFP